MQTKPRSTLHTLIFAHGTARFFPIGRKEWLYSVLLFAAYFLTARLGLLLATLHQNVSPVWPASGLAVAALMVLGTAYTPAIFAGAFLANLLAPTALGPSLLIACGNTLEAVVGACLIRGIYSRGIDAFFLLRTVAYPLGAIGSAAVSATIGVLTLWLSGKIPGAITLKVWTTWWVGDALGILTLVPLVWAIHTGTRPQTLRLGRILELGLLTLATGLLCHFVFLKPEGFTGLFLVHPLLFWAAHRFGRLAVKSLALVVAIVSIWGTVKGIGPFHQGSINQNLVSLQLFLSSISVTAIALAEFREFFNFRLPIVVLGVAWILSGAVFFSFENSIRTTDRIHFERLVERTRANIQEKIAIYENGLRGGVGLIAASDFVSRLEWQQYIQSFGLTDRYPGILGLGVIWEVPRRETSAFTRRLQKDHAPEFKIHSVTQNGIPGYATSGLSQYVVAYLSPVVPETDAAIGLDIGSEKRRREAAEKARDTGNPSITGKIELLQSRPSVQKGFLLYIPFYRTGHKSDSLESRRKNFLGWVYAPFASENFFADALGTKDRELEMAVYDGTEPKEESLFFDSAPDRSALKFDQLDRIELAQKTLLFAWSRSPSFASSRDTTGAWIAACATLVALLITAVTIVLQTMNQRAEKLAAEKTNELSQSQFKLRAIISASPVGIVVLDQNGLVTVWNHANEKMFGWNEEEVLGKPLPFVPEAKRAESQNVILSIQSSVLPTAYEVDRVRKDGSQILIRVTATPLLDANGRNVGLIAVLIDITEAKRYETSLLQTNEALQSATRAKSEFLANMSHEIRTPINGVLGLTGLLLKTPLDSEQRDFSENILRSAETLLALVNDVLDFSKIEAGKLELEQVEFELPRMLQDLKSTMGFAAEEKGIRLVLQNPPAFRTFFWGDVGRIRQVLTNLIGNAVKFTREGEVSFSVTVLQEAEKSTALRFEVKDTGIGIPKDSMEKMFQAFSQADSSVTRRFGGTGLGLSISKRLVISMGGKIGVESAEGKGSTFWFHISLPRGRTLDNARTSIQNAYERKSSLKQSARVLVAEDNAINQKVAIKILKNLGIHADAVANGHEAIEALRTVPYDLVLMDCQMPEMDGYEATSQIRKSTAAFKDIPIIAMTANVIKGDQERCLAVGMNDYVSKPIDLERLVDALEKWIPADPKAKASA